MEAYLILKAIFLGIIQGITEFLPVSSSGHLVIFERIFGLDASALGAFDIFLHFGTLLALILYFQKEIIQMIKELFVWRGDKWSERLIAKLFIASIPAGIVGIIFKDWIEANIRQTMAVGILLIATGILFLIAERFPKKKDKDKVGWGNVLAMGFIQVIGLLPGVSRSGSVIAGGLFTKLKRAEAARFAFLMALPAILGATIFQILDWGEYSSIYPLSEFWQFYLAGFLTALISSWWAIKFILKIFNKYKLSVFSIYLFAIGILIIIF